MYVNDIYQTINCCRCCCWLWSINGEKNEIQNFFNRAKSRMHIVVSCYWKENI